MPVVCADGCTRAPSFNLNPHLLRAVHQTNLLLNGALSLLTHAAHKMDVRWSDVLCVC